MEYLSQERYIAALERIHQQIENGNPLDYSDSETTGDKWTHCNWGLCSMDKEQWPDAADHMWPDQFIESGRVAPISRSKGQLCPMDRNLTSSDSKEMGPDGCFFRCRIFSPLKDRKGKKYQPDTRFILGLYEIALTKARSQP